MKNIRIFYLKICHFLVVKFSVYLNRRVFVMRLANFGHLGLIGDPHINYQNVRSGLNDNKGKKIYNTL